MSSTFYRERLGTASKSQICISIISILCLFFHSAHCVSLIRVRQYRLHSPCVCSSAPLLLQLCPQMVKNPSSELTSSLVSQKTDKPLSSMEESFEESYIWQAGGLASRSARPRISGWIWNLPTSSKLRHCHFGHRPERQHRSCTFRLWTQSPARRLRIPAPGSTALRGMNATRRRLPCARGFVDISCSRELTLSSSSHL